MADLKPDDRTLEALVRLERDPDFVRVIGWLSSLRTEEVETCMTMGPEIEVRRHQGRAMLLTEILSVIRDARKRMDLRREIPR